MTPDDPRHGTTAGYSAGCRDECCRTAIADWTRHARTRRYLRGPLTVNSVGTKRRIRALMALGWSTAVMDDRLGKRRTYTASILCGGDDIHRTTADQYRELYDRLSMALPPAGTRYEKQRATRVRNYARRQGWAPPLAWNDHDIDNPNARPHGLARTHPADQVDPVVVERIVGGDWKLRANPAERAAVIERWTADGVSLNEIERRTGWNVSRDLRRGRVA